MSKKLRVIMTVVIVAAAFYILNILTPLYGDDYSYTRNFVTKEPISSVGDICESMGIHYLRVNGRIVLHFLDQLFLRMGKGIFNVINTAAFVALIFLAYYLSCGTFRELCAGKWFVIAAGIFLLAPGFGQSYLWVTGAANYLFGMLFILSFLSLFVSNCKNERLRGVPAAIVFFVFGVLAGWTNENTGAALIAAVLLLIIGQKIFKKPVRLWMFTGLLGNIAGLSAIIFAPGESVRMANSSGIGTVSVIFERAVSISAKFAVYFLPAIVAAVILLVFFFIKKKNPRALFMPAVYAAAALVSTYSMAAAPYFPERTWSGTVIFGMIALMSIFNTVEGGFRPAAKKAAAAVIALVSAAVFCFAVKDVYAVKVAFDARESAVKSRIEAGERNISVRAIASASKYSCFEAAGDIEYDKNDWKNIAFARYWNVESVVREDTNE